MAKTKKSSSKRKAGPGSKSGPIKIVAAPVKTIPVELIGVKYAIRPPKAAMAMDMARQAKKGAKNPMKIARTMDEWIDIAFDDKAKSVRKRLKDPSDLLDMPHIAELMGALMEASAENPPTS